MRLIRFRSAWVSEATGVNSLTILSSLVHMWDRFSDKGQRVSEIFLVWIARELVLRSKNDARLISLFAAFNWLLIFAAFGGCFERSPIGERMKNEAFQLVWQSPIRDFGNKSAFLRRGGGAPGFGSGYSGAASKILCAKNRSGGVSRPNLISHKVWEKITRFDRC